MMIVMMMITATAIADLTVATAIEGHAVPVTLDTLGIAAATNTAAIATQRAATATAANTN